MLTFGAKAQMPVLTESFEGTAIPAGWTTIDADNDGHGWENNSLQNDLPSGHTGTGAVVSYSFDNASGLALTPNNWLVSPAVSLTGTSSLSFWFAVAQSYPADHFGVYVSTTSATDTSAFTLVYQYTPTSANGDWTQQTIDLTAYAGNTVYIAFRHFNCTDMFLLALDDITVSTTTTTPMIATTPTSLNFGNVNVGSSTVQTVNVLANNNTASITATVTAPFEVSADSITFGTTATLPAAGGTLYVKFAPTTDGLSSAVVTLTAGTLNATVNLSGNGFDCSPLTLPYTETFETNSPKLACWTVSGDAAWSIGTGDYSSSTGAYEGSNNALITHSDDGNVTKLISPAFANASTGLTLQFAYVMRSWYGDTDEFRVYYRSSASGAWQQVAEYTAAVSTWTVENITIPGSVYQVAFEMTDNFGYGVGIDSVAFVAMAADYCLPVVALTASNVTQTEATLTWTGNANSYTILDMSDGSVVATVTDTAYTLTSLTAMTPYTFGVVANCPTTVSDTVVVNFATACAAMVSLPFNETFDASSATRNCWHLVSMNTGNEIGTNNGMGFYTVDGREVLRFSSYSNHGGSNDYNQYGFSPLLDVSSAATFLNVSVTYATYSSSNTLYFGYVTPTDTIWDPTGYTTSGSSDWQTHTFVIPATATQLAVNYYGNYSFYAWIDTVSVTEITGEYCYPVTNLTATGVTAHEATLTWSGDANTYTVINMTDGTVLTTQADTSYNITGLTSETQYTFGVVANCPTVSSDTMTVNFTTLISCPVPTGLAATLTPGDGTVASLSWTENGTATEWQICLNGDTANLISTTTNPYNFTGLTPDTAYTVAVRANCDVNDNSVWSNAITFSPTNAYVLTVNDGTATNSYVPIYGLWVDDITKSQFIIPATALSAMQYGTIDKLTFYASNANVNWGVAEFSVYLTETNETTVSALADYNAMTQVYSGTLSISNNKMEVTLTTPYVYMGGNLKIGFLQTVSGTYSSCSWYGVDATGASMGGYGTSISQRNFLPKISIAFTPGTAPACLPVTNLSVSNVTDAQVTLTWNGTAASYDVYNGATFVANTTNTTYTITGLSAATEYVFGVQSICSATDSSIRVNVSATTECADVTALPYNEGFENGLGCWSTVNGSSDGQPWSVNNCSGLSTVNPHSGAYVASSWSWSTVAMHADAWLISPKFVLPNVTNDSLTFAWWETTNSGYPDSYSVVISTTTSDTAAFTTVLRPYDTASGTWTMRTVDLTAYAGQSVYLAFHHVDYNENYLLIDDISLFQGAYVPPAPDTLTVTFAVNDATMGTTVPAPGTYQYITGDTVSFQPVANPGYHFNNWVMSAAGQTDTLAPNYVSVYFLANSFMSYGTVTLTALFEADSTGTVTNPTVATNAATAVGETNATLHATITNPDDVTITAKGFEWKTTTGGTYTQIAGTGTGNTFTADLTGLTPNTGYTFKAFITYNGTTVYGCEMTFTTEDQQQTCPAPTNLEETGVIIDKAPGYLFVRWTDNAGASQWNLQYRIQGTQDWTTMVVNTTEVDIMGELEANETYELRVQAICGDGLVSDWSNILVAVAQGVGIDNYTLDNTVTVFPNPTSGVVQIKNEEWRIENVEVYDAYGKLLNVVNVNGNAAAIDMSDYAEGIYFLKVKTDNGMVTKRVVKQ